MENFVSSEDKWNSVNVENKYIPSSDECKNFIHRISFLIVSKFESSFFLYGKTISKRPVLFITFCLILTLCCSIGIFKFKTEERPFKLWIPEDSDFTKVMEWQIKNFPENYRIHLAIYEADNVLDSKVIKEMYRVHESVADISVNDADWNSVCAKIPSVTGSFLGRRKRSIQKNSKHKRQSNWLKYLTREDYCDLLESRPQECMEYSLLEIWGYDYDFINRLNNDQILKDINEATTSAIFGTPTNFSSYLGRIERDNNGLIIKAKAARHLWFTMVDQELIAKGFFEDDKGASIPVDLKGFNFEKEFINTLLNISEESADVKVFFTASASFGIIAHGAAMGDIKLLGVGFVVVFVYVQIVLGKFNFVEQRSLLSLCGISSVCLSIGVSYGICSIVGIPFNPFNNVLPFLLLGLGVDDMFVIVQSWNNLNKEEKKACLPDRIGYALKHSGVSITVTSLTDFAAFAIGCTTVLPGLRSFCLYAAVGILALYFFQATYFVAWFSLDQRRLEDNRHGLLWCWKLNNWSPSKCSQRDLCQQFFKNIFSKFLFKTPCKIFVLIFTFALLGASFYGLYHLEQEFDPVWFLPESTYLFKFFVKAKSHFPSNGERGIVYFGNISVVENLQKIEMLTEQLKGNKYISNVDSWLESYKHYWLEKGYDALDFDGDVNIFNDELSEFLHSPIGSKYRWKNFKFTDILKCREPVPEIFAFSIDFTHKVLSGSKEQIIARNEVKDVINGMNFSGYVQPWARSYSLWETDEIIEAELYRNIGLALVVVFIMTVIFLSSFITSLLVLLCVLMTLVDVGAFMHWVGLTIDVGTCVFLVLAVGLCVDYAAHIGHSFLTQEGTKTERASKAVSKMGPAILNGGFSTILAILFLSNSETRIFKNFFQVFLAVCLYGLYHGLIFLPIILSFVGPSSYESTAVSLRPNNNINKNGVSQNFNLKNEDSVIQPLNKPEDFRCTNL